MGAQGTVELDFGAAPGTYDAASIAVTGQAGILAGSLIEGWVYPLATVDHSVDEHILEPIKVFAHTIVPGTGFTVTGMNINPLNEGMAQVGANRTSGLAIAGAAAPQPNLQGGLGTRLYGKFTIAWVWV